MVTQVKVNRSVKSQLQTAGRPRNMACHRGYVSSCFEACHHNSWRGSEMSIARHLRSIHCRFNSWLSTAM